MAVRSGGSKDLSMAKKWLERESSPEKTRICIEPRPKAKELNVPVIYYLTRNGQLEHPHLMEVPVSSPQGILSLKDVINRLSFLRGQGCATLYSWSAKRSYKKGFVWQDLAENDFIYPCNGYEYVLKGTQSMKTSSSFRSYETISPTSSKGSSETNSSSTDADSPATIKKNLSWSLCDYQVYKAKTCRESAGKAVYASTQTEEKRIEREGEEEEARELPENEGHLPFSTSGYGGLEGSMAGYGIADIRDQRVQNERPSGRMKPSTVLMQLIRCGSWFEDREYKRKN